MRSYLSAHWWVSSATFRFKNVVEADNNTIYYIITNNTVTGLFEYDIQNDDETRLFHKNDIIEIGLDFLPSGIKYDAIVYADGPDAHWDDNPTSIEIEEKVVDNSSSLKIELAEGGGFAVSLIKK